MNLSLASVCVFGHIDKRHCRSFNPWHYSTSHPNPVKAKPPQDCWPTGDSLGAEKLPKVVAKMREIGEYIVANAPSTRPKDSTRPSFALHSSGDAGVQPPSGFVQDRFAISFFLDPSPSEEAYSFIRAANFSTVLGANHPSNQSEADSMLKMCIKYDLKCITNLKRQLLPYETKQVTLAFDKDETDLAQICKHTLITVGLLKDLYAEYQE